MAETKTFREAMKENNAKFKADLKASNAKIKAESREREERAEVKRLAKIETNASRPVKVKATRTDGKSSFMSLMEILMTLPMMLFSLAVILGVGTFAVMLLWSIFFG